MSVYAVAQIDIADRKRYADYEAGFIEVFVKYGGEFLAVDDEVEVLEGTPTAGRLVIMRFADRDQFMAWYESPEYQELAAIRREASTGSVVLLRGLD